MPVISVVFCVDHTKDNKYNKYKYLPEDGQELTETCRRIIKTFKQYNYFNVLFLIK